MPSALAFVDRRDIVRPPRRRALRPRRVSEPTSGVRVFTSAEATGHARAP